MFCFSLVTFCFAMEVVMFCFRILVFQRMGIGGGGVSTPPKVVVYRRCRRWCFGAGNWFHAFWFLFFGSCFCFALGGGGAMSFRSVLGFFAGAVAVFIACSVLRQWLDGDESETGVVVAATDFPWVW